MGTAVIDTIAGGARSLKRLLGRPEPTKRRPSGTWRLPPGDYSTAGSFSHTAKVTDTVPDTG